MYFTIQAQRLFFLIKRQFITTIQTQLQLQIQYNAIQKTSKTIHKQIKVCACYENTKQIYERRLF